MTVIIALDRQIGSTLLRSTFRPQRSLKWLILHDDAAAVQHYIDAQILALEPGIKPSNLDFYYIIVLCCRYYRKDLLRTILHQNDPCKCWIPALSGRLMYPSYLPTHDTTLEYIISLLIIVVIGTPIPNKLWIDKKYISANNDRVKKVIRTLYRKAMILNQTWITSIFRVYLRQDWLELAEDPTLFRHNQLRYHDFDHVL
jgi:hypothetical protein